MVVSGCVVGDIARKCVLNEVATGPAKGVVKRVCDGYGVNSSCSEKMEKNAPCMRETISILDNVSRPYFVADTYCNHVLSASKR